ncbi:MAG: nucleotidyltransferase family protein [Prevotellaceae bacterium]|jgi:NDP-sugar pyrophosphorylase family protein|nr:nucleotidyltransferase family protein [Prevotellaceae bacterium]
MKTAMIFAAGLGTRLRPLTDKTPKALVEIGGKTLLQIAIERLQDAGFQRIVINAHHFAEQIFEFVQNHYFDVEIIISHEKDLLLDTGSGIFFAKEKIGTKKPFLLHNVDIISNADLQKLYDFHNPETLATLLVSSRNTSRYLLFNEENILVGWTNVKTGEIKTPFKKLDLEKCKMLSFNGIHVISPKIFELMQNFEQPFSIIDFYLSVCRKEKILACQQPDLEVIDVGTVEKLENAKNWGCLKSPFSRKNTKFHAKNADY